MKTVSKGQAAQTVNGADPCRGALPAPQERGGTIPQGSNGYAGTPPGNEGALLERFGLSRSAHPGTSPAPSITEVVLQKCGFSGGLPAFRRQLGANVRQLVTDLKAREASLVAKVGPILASLGLAARKLATMNDLRQAKDFAQLAIEEGRPLEVFTLLGDVLGFIVEHPLEARRVLEFIDRANPDTWTQKTAWTRAAVGPSAVPASSKAGSPKAAEVVVIGAGLSGGSVAHHFARAAARGNEPTPSVLIIERDKKSTREHAASLRNAGIVCTAMEYVFGIDEAIGDKPIERLQDALGVSRPEAESAYRSLMNIMRDSRARLERMMGEKVGETGPSCDGGLDVAITEQDVADFRAAAAEARRMGFDWEVVDAPYLDAHFGLKSDDIKGAIFHHDGGQVHSGKLLRALFDQAVAASKQIEVQWETELLGARQDPSGEGWLLETSQGPICAKHVIDAREGFAPFRWREARYSQIHVVDVPSGSGPMRLGETNLCHGLSYMRKIDDGKYLVGSGDFPVHDTTKTPAPLASVALYTAAMFKKLFPDVPFDIERVWGGVFGLSTDGIPVCGEVADRWHVVGGAGGQGLSLMPALAEDTVNQILGRTDRLLFLPSEDFSPRRFFLKELRHDLLRALRSVSPSEQLTLEELRVEVVDGLAPGGPLAQAGEWVFQVDAQTLDAMNPDVGVLLGEQGSRAIWAREQLKADWIRRQIARVRGDPLPVPDPRGCAPTEPTASAA